MKRLFKYITVVFVCVLTTLFAFYKLSNLNKKVLAANEPCMCYIIHDYSGLISDVNVQYIDGDNETIDLDRSVSRQSNYHDPIKNKNCDAVFKVDNPRKFIITYKVKKGYSGKIAWDFGTTVGSCEDMLESFSFDSKVKNIAFNFMTEKIDYSLNLVNLPKNVTKTFNISNYKNIGNFTVDTYKAGKKFIGWKHEDGTIVNDIGVPSSFFNDDNTNTSYTLEAVYEDVDYELELLDDKIEGIKSISISPNTAKYNEKFIVSIHFEDGYYQNLAGYLRNSEGNHLAQIYLKEGDNEITIPDNKLDDNIIKLKLEKPHKRDYYINYNYNSDLYKISGSSSSYYNEKVEFSVKPYNGVIINKVSLVDQNNEIELKNMGNDTYSFIMPLNTVEVVIEYETYDINIEWDLNGGNISVDLPNSYNRSNSNGVFFNGTPKKTGYTFNGWSVYTKEEYDNLMNSSSGDDLVIHGEFDYVKENETVKEIEYVEKKPEIFTPVKGKGKGDWTPDYSLYYYTLKNYNSDNLVIVANYAVNKYTITISGYDEACYDGEEIIVNYGTEIGSAIKTLKDYLNDNTINNYQFIGFYKDDSFVTPLDETSIVKNNITIYPLFEQIKDEYTITFEVNGKTIVTSVKRGKMPVYDGEKPVKTSDLTNSYEFIGWIPQLQAANKDITYTPEFKATPVKYTVTFMNENNKVSEKEYSYGATIDIPSAPLKNKDAKYSYEFIGWFNSSNNEKVNSYCVGTAVYEAKYKEIVNQYIVTWNVNGTKTLVKYDYNAFPSFTGNTSKESDKEYDYKFIGWDKELKNVTEDTEYTAIYDKKYKTYVITFFDQDGNEIEKISYHYNEKIKFPSYDSLQIEDGKAFVGWVDENGQPINSLIGISESIRAIPSIVENSTIISNIIVEEANEKDFNTSNFDSIKDLNDNIYYYNVYRKNLDNTISTNGNGEFTIDKPLNDKNAKFKAYVIKDDGSILDADINDIDDKLLISTKSLGKVVLVSEIPNDVDLTKTIAYAGAGTGSLLLVVLGVAARTIYKKKAYKKSQI